MKLTKHQKQIVDAIIAGTVFDIPSYLREFNKWHLCKYDLSRPLAKFEEEEGDKQYKVIIDKDKFYIQTKSPMNTGFGTYYVDMPIPRKPEDIPDDSWEYKKAELIRNIKPVEVEYCGESFTFDFVEAGVNVVDDFDDIIEFMGLWAYLRKESLVLEVPRDVTADDLGILFELKPKKPKPEIPFVIHRDKAPDSSAKPITRVTGDLDEFYPSPPVFLLTSYMDEEWVINGEHQKNCEEYIGRKILPTGKLKTFKQQLYTTADEWQYRIPLFISIVALLLSLLPVVQSFFPSKEADHLAQISQQIAAIEQFVQDETFSDDIEEIWDKLSDISEVVDEMRSNYDTETVDALVEQINRLNNWLEAHENFFPPTE